MKNAMAWLNLGALLSLSVGFGAAAQADEIIVRKTQFAPSQVILTPAETVTTRTTTVEQSPTTILTPTPFVADDTVSRSTMIVRERPASGSSVTTSYEGSKDGTPEYGKRIRLMTEQLDKGLRNGWVTSDRASELRSQLADLQSEEVRVRTNGYLKADCDSIEKRLTGFNIELSHSLEGHTL